MRDMEQNKIHVLLVEDDPDDALLTRENLQDSAAARFEIEHVERLGEAIKLFDREHFDVVLLDLSLPDSTGLGTLAQTRSRVPHVPIVVLTGLADDTRAKGAMREGAQDYLVKGKFDSELLGRSILYAIERQRLLLELEDARHREQQERELGSLQQISSHTRTSISAGIYGALPLCKSQPRLFKELEGRYGDIMELALEQRQFKVEHNISDRIRSMADDLGFLRAGPRDAVDLHSSTLKRKIGPSNPAKTRAYTEEGRFMLLELMGCLVSFYRNYLPGTLSSGASQKDVQG